MVEIIAEIGVNHNGDLRTAFQMIDAAKDAGADVAKFQLFRADSLVQKTAPVATYQAENIGTQQTQYNMLKGLELSYEEHIQLSDYCKSVGIEYLSTAFDDESLEFLQNVVNQKRFKIPSGEITNGLFLAKHAMLSKPLILSTGMASLAEVETAISVISYVFKKGDLYPRSLDDIRSEFISDEVQKKLKEMVTLLHCSSEYPAPMDTVNLLSMQTLGQAFNLDCGYSDHTNGVEIAIAATTLGASIIEKHFTLDKTAKGPDHAASLNPDELKLMVSSIRNVEKALGSTVKRPSVSELETAKLARKSLVASRDICRGEVFTAGNLNTLRPGNGMSPILLWDLIGKEATREYKKGEEIRE